jgi:glycosyltransferase involved in cell wall biosynthesis
MNKPFFSVLVATYNRAHLIRRALDSIWQQSFADFEVLVIDDASTDATREIVTAISEPRLRYLRMDENGGAGQARNFGIAQAQGEFVAFVDDDDTIDPAFLAEIYAAIAKAPPTLGFLWTWKEVVRQSEDGLHKVREMTYDSNSDMMRAGKQLLQKVMGGSGGLVVRASALRVTGGFDPKMRAVEDSELLIRLASHFDYIIIPHVLYRIYAAHDNARLSAPNLRSAQGFERIIEIHSELLQAYPETLRVQYLGCARNYYQLGERRKARYYMSKLLKLDALNIKNWLLFFLLENLKWLPASFSQRVTRNFYA